MDERDILNAWRTIFQANGANQESLAKAEALLEGFTGESPLHLRLSNELEELKKNSAPRTAKIRR